VQALIAKQFSEGIGLTGMDQMSIMAPSYARSSEDKDSEEEEEEEKNERQGKKKGGNKKDGHVQKKANGKGGKGGQDGKGKEKGKEKGNGKGKGKGKPAELKMKMHLHKRNQDVASKRREIVEAIDIIKGNKLAAAVRKDFYLGWTGRMGRHGTHERIMNHKMGF
jgi:hypothetical protein